MRGQWKAAVANQVRVLSVLLASVRALVLAIIRWLRTRRRAWGMRGMARAARLSHEYLSLRLQQFQQDVERGGGRTVEELAALVKLRQENVPVFGALLRVHRHELLALAEARTLTPARALKLMQRVSALVLADPLLRKDLLAALVAHRDSRPPVARATAAR